MPPTGEALFKFRRRSLAEQAAAALRDSIRQGLWGPTLPGEHELARRLSISRPTVRAALTRLADDGLLEVHKGRHTRIRSTEGRLLETIPPTVCLIHPSPRDTQISAFASHPLLSEMRARFATQGIGWEEVHDRNLGGRAPERRLDSLVRGRRHVCWLLIGATPAIQRWFQQSRLPTLVLGSCHEGIELPSVDVDYHAIGWHAAGILARNGHERVVLISTQPALPGDLACLAGLQAYVTRQGRPLSISNLPAGTNCPPLQAGLNRLLTAADPPTAILSLHVPSLLTSLIHLLRSGYRVPEDISLLCRVTDISLDLGIPDLTRYRNPVLKQARQAERLVRSLLAGNVASTVPVRIMPAFVPGATVARARP